MKFPSGSLGKFTVPLAAASFIVVADQVSKWAVEAFMPFQQPFDMLPFFALFRTYNTGIAFSMLAGLDAFALIVIAIGVSLFVAWLWWQSPPHHRLSHFGFALVLGGAVGNLIDRVRFGHVVDYFLFHAGNWSFAIFNLADAAITVGAGLVLVDETLAWWRQRQGTKSG